MSSTEGRISNSWIAALIGLLVAAYLVGIAAGILPRKLTPPHKSAAVHTAEESRPEDASHAAESQSPAAAHGEADPHGEASSSEADHGAVPPVYFVFPFVCLLLAIAVFPLMRATELWWESNLHRLLVAIGASLMTLGLYLTLPLGWGEVQHVLEHALVQEYVPFIVLLFSLYSISGGIRIQGDLRARPRTNAIFIGVGGLLASLIGTTGAAMLLIRPLLETNQERKYVQHTVVLFIFVVCNCGGCLLPIGDPPLFLGYLEGVPFFWTLHLFWPWLFVNVGLLTIYLIMDTYVYFPSESKQDLRLDAVQTTPLRVRGWQPNAWLLLGVVLCVALLDPTKPFPGTHWHAWPFLREVVQLALVAASLYWGDAAARRDNHFNFHAIQEVAALFIGIFICMQPALAILNERGPSLGMDTPHELYAVTGGLSSVLDNAPTYLVFFRTAAAQFGGVTEFARLVSSDDPSSHTAKSMLVGISLGAVFMGSMTYIGNGPNFMVRAIAEQSGVRMPSFFGYVLWYSVPILLPLLALTAWIFL